MLIALKVKFGSLKKVITMKPQRSDALASAFRY
jgi:hypothetical protein